MNEELQMVIDMAKESMENALAHLKNELIKLRAGKATPGMLDGIKVDCYGTHMPLNQLSNINSMDARTLSIQPWDKSMLDPIDKAISAANLGVNPQKRSDIIIVSFPPLSEERRKGLVKQLKNEAEHAKVGVRNSRREANDEIKNLQKSGLPEDMAKDGEASVQKLTDEYIGKVDAVVVAKEKDILTV